MPGICDLKGTWSHMPSKQVADTKEKKNKDQSQETDNNWATIMRKV